jgi:predicted phosphodiesterase
MRVAVLSDVHANLPALEAVLSAIEAEGIDELWCLGDVVGYGADPDACAQLIEQRTSICLAGNHDLVVAGRIDIDTFAAAAAEAARWTRATISDATQEFLVELEPQAERAGFGLYHASPRDPVWEYVLSFEQAEASLEQAPQRLSLIGHSHVACFFNDLGGRVTGEQAGADQSFDTSEGSWLLNPGSVGQPRDGDPRAAFLVLDSDDGEALYRRVEYPIEQAATAIIDAGLPRQLADRLYLGQ